MLLWVLLVDRSRPPERTRKENARNEWFPTKGSLLAGRGCAGHGYSAASRGPYGHTAAAAGPSRGFLGRLASSRCLLVAHTSQRAGLYAIAKTAHPHFAQRPSHNTDSYGHAGGAPAKRTSGTPSQSYTGQGLSPHPVE